MVNNLKKILVCLDGSKHSEKALSQAVLIAKNIDSQTSRIRELEAENKHLKALISDYKTLMMDKVSELDPGSDGDSPPPDTYNLSVVLGEKKSVQRLEVVVEEAHR